MTPADIRQMIWDSFSPEEQRVYALLSIPVRFDETLAAQLADASGEDKHLLGGVFRQHTFVYRYKTQGWYFEDGFREFLLDRAEEIHKDEIRSIHRLLLNYYQKIRDMSDAFEKRAHTYLILYHTLQIDPGLGLNNMLDTLANSEEAYLGPMLKSLVHVCDMPKRTADGQPAYAYLKEYRSFLFSTTTPEALRESENRLKRLYRKLDKDLEKPLASHVLRLRIAINEKTSGKKTKLRNKLHKKLDRLCGTDACESSELPETDDSRSSHVKFLFIRETVSRIISLHRKGLHENGFGEAQSYLVTLHGDEKDKLSKSYCNIGSGIQSTNAYEWQLRYYDLAIKSNPFDAVPYTAKAELLASKGKTVEALKHFDRGHQFDPRNVVALTGKAELLARLGRTDEALEHFDRAHHTDPHDVVALNGKAELLARLGKTDDAFEHFDRAQQTDPHNVVALNGKAELLARLGKTIEALEYFDRAHQTDPHDVVALTGKAELLARLGKTAEALEHFDRAQQTDPHNVVALTGKAELLARLGRTIEALEHFSRAHQTDPHDVVALTGKAELLARLGRTDEALEHFDRAHQTDPHNVVALNGKAELLARLGKTAEALEHFDRAHQTDPHNLVTLSGRANLIAKKGYVDEAIAEYRRIKDGIGKNNPYTLRGLGFLLLKRNRDENEIRESVGLFKEAFEIPDSREISALGLWVAHARLGLEAEAVRYREIFEADRSHDTSEISQEENAFNQIKASIRADTMTSQDQYRVIIGTVLAYAQLVMRRKQAAQSFHRFGMRR